MKKSEIKKLVGRTYFDSVDEMTPRDICMSYLKKHGWLVITMGEGGNGNEMLHTLNLLVCFVLCTSFSPFHLPRGGFLLC